MIAFALADFLKIIIHCFSFFTHAPQSLSLSLSLSRLAEYDSVLHRVKGAYLAEWVHMKRYTHVCGLLGTASEPRYRA